MSAVLRITEPDGRSWEKQLVPGALFSIGRAKENDIVLNDRRVSRRHAHITSTGNTFNIVDGSIENGEVKRSVNHVFVNGSPMLEKPLEQGDIVIIGESKLEFVQKAPPQVSYSPQEMQISIPPIAAPKAAPAFVASATRSAPAATSVPRAVDYDDNPLGQTQMKYVQTQLQKSKAAWKVMANEVTVMPTKVLGGSYFTYDGWQGYPQEREELLTYIRDNSIPDVVFVTGDIHTFITGDVRTNMGDGDTVAIELVGGSVTSQGLGESDVDGGAGVVIKGNDANPNTPPALIEALRGINPWVKAADFDHHGFAKVTATQTGFDCTLVRLQTIKQRSKATLPPGSDYAVHIARGQKSLFA